MRHSFFAAAFTILSWAIGWNIGAWMFSGPSAEAYGMLCGWWITAYLSQLLGVGREHLLSAAAAVLFLSLGLSIAGVELLYRDVAYADFLHLLVIAVGHAAVAISPIFFNFLMTKMASTKLGSTLARVKLKGIDGGPHKRWSMWYLS